MSNIDIFGMKDSAGNTLYFPNGGGGGASLLRADYETSPATAAHAIDDILYYNNKFYDVTSAIAIGDTLTVSSGSTVGNISERLGGMSYEVFGIPGGGSGGTVTADDVFYDNTSSGLSATNVQDAVDELSSNNISDTIDISAYTSSEMYTAPTDGYVYLQNNTANQTSDAVIVSASNNRTVCAIGGNKGLFSIFIRKGMRVYPRNSPSSIVFTKLG